MDLALRCPAYYDPDKPCWELEGTCCDKILGTPKTCDMCDVYLTYSHRSSP
jgi:hypothetical protein